MSTQKFKIALIPALLTFFIYLPSLRNDFVWDDGYLIVNNPAIHHLSSIPEFFVTPWAAQSSYSVGSKQNNAYWRPIAETSFTLDYVISGGKAYFFHFMNDLLHAITTYVVALILLSLGFPGFISILGALFFGLHPVNTEAVNVICYRTTILSGLFGWLAVYVYITYDSIKGFIVVWLLFLLALLSKETAGAFLLIIPLFDLIVHRKPEVVAYTGLIMVAGVYWLIHQSLTSHGLYVFFSGLDAKIKLLIAFKIVYMYVKLLFIPWPLTPFYDWWILGQGLSGTSPEVVAGGILLILYPVLLFISWKRNRTAFAGLLIFLAGLLPVSHIVPFFDPMAERFLYIPLVGISIVIAALLQAVKPYKIARLFLEGLMIIMLVGFSGLTVARTMMWHNTEGILIQKIEDFPESIGTYIDLGKLYLRQKKYKQARELFSMAIKKDKEYPLGWVWLSVLDAMEGNIKQADMTIKRAEGIVHAGVNVRAMVLQVLASENRQDLVKRLNQ